MTSGNMRRAQLVSPFGVGAMSVLVDGTSVITAGLDHWFPRNNADLALEDFRVHDWRLEARLKVQEFRLPPDYRKGSSEDHRNEKLNVPALRFPCYSFCMYCKKLRTVPLSFQDDVRCDEPTCMRNRRLGPKMSQVPFVAICRRGHIDDFPFNEWVHRSKNPTCAGVLRLVSTGGGGLEGQVVRCGYDAKQQRDERLGCGASRSLQGITTGGLRNELGEESTFLTLQLAGRQDPYMCTGARPWLHEEHGTCDQPLQGALRASGNVYFPYVESSIFLPQEVGAVSGALRDLMRRADVEPTMAFLFAMRGKSATVTEVRQATRGAGDLFDQYSDDELLAVYEERFGIGSTEEEVADDSGDLDIWRFPEFKLLRETPQDDELRAMDPGVSTILADHVDRVRSVTVLRETRVLRGFTRGQDNELKVAEGKAMLRRRPLAPGKDWLPAYVVRGEGIYFELDGERLSTWEARDHVQARADLIATQYGRVITDRGGNPRDISPRMIMLHTLAHLLINELVFTCGYSSASLRERLYVSRGGSRDMAGLLIYTAAGDSEGTMGGLVRMSRPDRMQPVFSAALSDAHWCSTDPVCMDAGERGQGPDSCNLAACHGCALLPETSCEEFNRFLDRGLVIGTFDNPNLGFFSDLN